MALLFSLFSNLGGALSLWMGLSFVVVVEVAEIAVDLFAKVCVGKKKSKNAKRGTGRKASGRA